MELLFDNLIIYQNVQNLKVLTKIKDIVNAKNTEIANQVIMRVFNEVNPNKP